MRLDTNPAPKPSTYSFLPERRARVMTALNVWEWLNKDWSNLRPTPGEGTHDRRRLDDQDLEEGQPRDLG